MEVDQEEQSPPMPHIPQELLPTIFAALAEAQDLSSAAQVCRAWRDTVYTVPEAGFQQAFCKDYGAAAAAEFAARKTWRDKYIARTIDVVCRSLREKASELDDLEDTSAALERSIQNSMVQLSHLDRTLNHRRWDLNKLLGDVAGKASTHSGSALGKEILTAARGEVDWAKAKKSSSGGGSGGGSSATGAAGSGSSGQEQGSSGGGGQGADEHGEAAAAQQWFAQDGWRARLTLEAATQLAEAEQDVRFWADSLKENREALRGLYDGLGYVTDSIRAARAEVQALRRKRACLEAATTYRHTMRRA